MGACASIPKAMKAEAADTPAPEPPMEETPATDSVEQTTAPAEEEAAENKAEGGNDAKLEEKAVEIDAPKEAADVESEKLKTEAPAPLETEVAAEKEMKTEVAEQK